MQVSKSSSVCRGLTPPVGQPILAGWSDAAKIKGCNHAAAVIPPASHRALSAGLFSMRMVWAADAPPSGQGVLPCCWRCYGIKTFSFGRGDIHKVGLQPWAALGRSREVKGSIKPPGR